MSPGSTHDPRKPATTDRDRIASVVASFVACLIGTLAVLSGLFTVIGGLAGVHDLGLAFHGLALTAIGGGACVMGSRRLRSRC